MSPEEIEEVPPPGATDDVVVFTCPYCGTEQRRPSALAERCTACAPPPPTIPPF